MWIENALQILIDKMNKKLRLLVTARCENNCPLCCNNQFNMKFIDTITLMEAVANYEEISITGGNPLHSPIRNRVKTYIAAMRGYEPAHRAIYIYTNTCDYDVISEVINWPIDGITITPHTKEEFMFFNQLNSFAKQSKAFADSTISFRLNLMGSYAKYLYDSLWEGFNVKYMTWKKDCPVPQGEDFKRIPILL